MPDKMYFSQAFEMLADIYEDESIPAELMCQAVVDGKVELEDDPDVAEITYSGKDETGRLTFIVLMKN